jgi:hypothetical protein
MPTVCHGRTKVVVAGDKREDLQDEELWGVLSKAQFNNGKSLDSVGFYKNRETEELAVVLPKAFAKPSTRSKLAVPEFTLEQVYSLVRVFQKIVRETDYKTELLDSNISSYREGYPSDPVLDSIEGAFLLRDDFLRNGLYISKVSRLTKNRWDLPLNWNRTFSRFPPLLQCNEVLFTESIQRKRNRDTKDPLLRLQATCLFEIFALLGEPCPYPLPNVLEEAEFKRIKSRPRAYLRKLRATTFTDRGRRILSCISSYLGMRRLNASEARDGDYLRFSSSFENIWERILREVLSSDSNLVRMPPGRWYAVGQSMKTTGVPEVDFKISGTKAEALVDAKDYRVDRKVLRMGSAGDHYKQVIYRHLSKPPKGKYFCNILMFPSIDQKNLFELRGMHEWAEINNSRVFEVNVDYRKIVKKWLGEGIGSLSLGNEIECLFEEIYDLESATARVIAS